MAKKQPKILTKKVLAEEIAEKQGLTKKAATEVVNYIFDEAATTLKKGGTVDIFGFGKMSITKRKARKGRNPQTGEVIKIKATKVPTFKASKTLKELVK